MVAVSTTSQGQRRHRAPVRRTSRTSAGTSAATAAGSSRRRWSRRWTSSTACYEKARADRGVPRRARPAAPRLHRPPVAADRRPQARRARRRRADPAQARGPQPHRLAQDQQRAGPGAAHQADGQDAGDRRDRRRASTAWPPRPRARCSAWSAWSTWARSTPSGRRSTSPGCGCSAPTVIPVKTGSRTLKDAINEALRDWVTNVDETHYLLGTVAGPHPFPAMVRDFHRVIGLEAREQVLERVGRLPDAVAACVGGGSNAIGIFHAFLDDPGVRLVGFEPGGDGVETGRHGATLSEGSPGALHGALSYLLQDEDGQTARVVLDLRRAGLPRRRAGARAAQGPRPGRVPADHRRRGDGRRSRCSAAPRGSSRRSSRRTPSPARCGWAASSGPTGWCWSTCPGAATRTWTPPPGGSG